MTFVECVSYDKDLDFTNKRIERKYLIVILEYEIVLYIYKYIYIYYADKDGMWIHE